MLALRWPTRSEPTEPPFGERDGILQEVKITVENRTDGFSSTAVVVFLSSSVHCLESFCCAICLPSDTLPRPDP